jgi:hypothetical protein
MNLIIINLMLINSLRRYLKNEFNVSVQDDPTVKYYSIAGDAEISPANILYLPYLYIHQCEGIACLCCSIA